MPESDLVKEFKAIIQSLVHRGVSADDIQDAFIAAFDKQFPDAQHTEKSK